MRWSLLWSEMSACKNSNEDINTLLFLNKRLHKESFKYLVTLTVLPLAPITLRRMYHI